MHPRTRQRLDASRQDLPGRLYLTEPLGYLQFLALLEQAALVITDSGGIQEESTCLGVPCLTARDGTERPITVEVGTNRLVGKAGRDLVGDVDAIINGDTEKGARPPLWDGQAARRIQQIILTRLPG